MKQSIMTILYNDNHNLFTDEFGQVEYNISDIMPIDTVLYYKREGGTYRSKINGEIFDIEFPFREVNRSIYYDPVNNIFEDEEGDFIFNLYSIIRPNDLLLFKKEKRTIFVNGIRGGRVEINYPFG